MQTITIGDLISGLVDVYEQQYEDHELATVKAALVVDELLRKSRPARSARPLRAMRGSARKAA